MLINCPNCGKMISDKAKQCIHCQTVFEKTAEALNSKPEKIDYLSLTNQEIKTLTEEFYKAEPGQGKVIKQVEILHKIIKFSKIFTVLLVVIELLNLFINWDLLESPDPPSWVLIIMLGALALVILVFVIFVFIIIYLKLSNPKLLRAYKHMEVWLSNKNIVNFTLVFSSAKEEQQFKEMDLN